MKPSPRSNSVVDRLVADAMRKPQDAPDLLAAGIPFTPALWMIVVEPLKARTVSDGGIEVVGSSQEAEDYQVVVGRILSAGPAALDGQTTGGVKLNQFTADISKPEQLVGVHVVYQRHVGQELRLRKTEQRVMVMKVTDLLGVTDDPYAWKFYI